ncbi:hypothetical protein M408DRAFT_284199 [Serendipita vermifera MAFF 305830]|uniref:AB hydrolase-1 domain-containing protein n=1 Tax=Serendipita vermifera MAFF 305830 TaxID=933852 RepID=A0A0C2WYQ1_SERVB|nr:hypothetical protein M408DRAFT_284199 [Serendipita vermifera MAFF 305830]
MLSSLALLATLGGIYPALAAVNPRNTDGYQDTLTWGNCTDLEAPFECSTFTVPLDYANPSVGNTTLAVIRIPAKTSPREGYMFYNPGGPGGSGLEFLAAAGPQLQDQIGAGWDVLSWDPRGVGGSGPDIAPFETAEEADMWLQELQGTDKYDAHGNLTQSADAAFFRTKAPEFDAHIQSLDTKLKEKGGENLKYVGSCAVVRDLVGLTDAIYGTGSDVNFYGYSYGTVLVHYLTQMFPHRVGRVIADGVVDSHKWTRTPTMEAQGTDIRDAEAALHAWTSACAAAAPGNCTLATFGNGTADGVLRVIDSVLDTIYQTYDGTEFSQASFNVNQTLPENLHALPFEIASTGLYVLLYKNTTWTALDQIFSTIYALQNNLTNPSNSTADVSTLKARAPRFGGSSRWSFATTGFSHIEWAVTCSDSRRYPANYTAANVFEDLIRLSQTVSSHFGTVYTARPYCHGLTTRAIERLGDIPSIPYEMNIKPKNVVLVIGNEADLITPYESAQVLASKKRLGNKARLVKYNAIGHTSGSNWSTCINDVIHSYVRGNAPADKGDNGPDVVCEVDSTPFT